MKEAVFVDSFAWIAAINKTDNYHAVVLKTLENLIKHKTKLFTTSFIVIETINALSKVEFRKSVIEFVGKLQKSPSAEIVKITDEIYNSAWELYKQRKDKNWGITDCTSFEVMRLFDIKKAFTNDKHFEQAGYSLVLK
jgi:predicted nucleic acid-binding protein